MILDVTIGARKIYQNWDKKLNDPIVGIDIRKGDFSLDYESQWTKCNIIIKPTILADMASLPFQDNTFNTIIFDPPHMDCGTLTGFWAKKFC